MTLHGHAVDDLRNVVEWSVSDDMVYDDDPPLITVTMDGDSFHMTPRQAREFRTAVDAAVVTAWPD